MSAAPPGPLRGSRASPQRQEAFERTIYASLYDEEEDEAQGRGGDDSVKKKGGLSLMVQSGLCYTFELRLDRWQGMAESSDAETVLQAITEMARVRLCARGPLGDSGPPQAACHATLPCAVRAQDQEVTLSQLVRTSYHGLESILQISAVQAHVEADVCAARLCGCTGSALLLDVRRARSQENTDLIRQWQGWVALRAAERWMDIVAIAYRNVFPFLDPFDVDGDEEAYDTPPVEKKDGDAAAEKRRKEREQLGDSARKLREPLRVATNSILAQVSSRAELRPSPPALRPYAPPQLTSTYVWWLSLGLDCPWTPEAVRRRARWCRCCRVSALCGHRAKTAERATHAPTPAGNIAEMTDVKKVLEAARLKAREHVT
jgi:hypothetical protein